MLVKPFPFFARHHLITRTNHVSCTYYHFISATRETAFLHAISSAGITHEFTHQCSKNRIAGCKCGKTRTQPNANSGWQWGGCSDDIKFGEKETRGFIDKLEKGNDARTAFNLHNNEVGRKVSLWFMNSCFEMRTTRCYLWQLSVTQQIRNI